MDIISIQEVPQQQQLIMEEVPHQTLSEATIVEMESGSMHVRTSDKAAKWWVLYLQMAIQSMTLVYGDLGTAFHSLGVVYGDMGTSPMYVYSSTFSNGIKHEDDIIGVLSIIFYTITLIALVKYIFIVLRATYNGEGGTFALYSLICRHANVGLILSQGAEDGDLSTCSQELPNDANRLALRLKYKLENSKTWKLFLLLAAMLGTSMVIADSVLTPCISVLSAVGGLKKASSAVTEEGVVWIAIAILVLLFMVQRLGTDKVGIIFAPIICLWFSLIGSIGIYNLVKYDAKVVKAVNPIYIIDYFKRNKKNAWISLGGTVLSITGTEALFADVGHFTIRSIKISMCCVTYPALIVAYAGQASFLRKNSQFVADAFFKSIPHVVYWPTFVVAVLASVIASQAMISGTFSIIQQSLPWGCFPRVQIVHTSNKHRGQVYIPEVNYLLMLACIAITLGFRTTERIGVAYGIAVVLVMSLTSLFIVLVMVLIWETHILIVMAYCLVIGGVEFIYFSSVLYKFNQGGYMQLVFALFLMSIMYIWNYVYRKIYNFELDQSISINNVEETMARINCHRLPGLAIFHSDIVHGIPPIFKHYLTNVPAVHSVLLFVSFKSLPMSESPTGKRFIFSRAHPADLYVFHCVVTYGYNDMCNSQEPFESSLLERLREFISEQQEEESVKDRELEVLDRAQQNAVVHLEGVRDVIAKEESSMVKKVVINYCYNFLNRNIRQRNKVFDVPYKHMLNIGMTYEL
ncbi:potassium transporter 5-like [Lycium ferocissimum]|uniref:potassium transporter 5-like n=1 Tax=Lycium ferocissimum TaxID=112874 RepID=UPI002815F177|nr:potassium transporter 5-like [Lycium ferocissimum]